MRWFSRRKKAPYKSLEADTYIRMGDAANAQRQWDVAAEHYRRALASTPDNCAIHIQYGHCLKEQGLLKEAEAAYRNAVQTDDSDADAYLHLGHISKLQRHMSDAIAAYKVAAQLGSKTSVGDDALRELTALGVHPPAVVAIDIPASVADNPAYKELVTALKHNQFKEARAALRPLAQDGSPDIKLIEAQLRQRLGKFDEAIALLDDESVRDLGARSFSVLRALYNDRGEQDKGIRSALWEIKEGLRAGLSFDTLADPVAYLAKLGKLEAAFEACASIFQPETRTGFGTSRSAADVKRARGSSHFPEELAERLHGDLLARASVMEADGTHAQAMLLRHEAEALKPSATHIS